MAFVMASPEGQEFPNAGIYLDTFGHIVIGWLWLRMALIASRALDGAMDARGAGDEFRADPGRPPQQ